MQNISSLYNLDYTYHYSKYSCISSFYFLHVIACYFVFLSGILCFFTRLFNSTKFLHIWMGRLYILSMLYATATSLLIHNAGLPPAVLISFIYVVGGLTIGWFLINLHQLLIKRKINKILEGKKNFIEGDVPIFIEKLKNKIVNNKKCIHRLFSLKTFHALFMFISWFNITGRIFASDQSGDFTCYTYPVYKPVNSSYGITFGMNLENQPLSLLPETDPHYYRLPWAGIEVTWSVILFVGPLIFGFLIGLIYTSVYTCKNNLKFC